MSSQHKIRSCPLPDGALLNAYRLNGMYTDCFATEVAGSISHEQFVTAFYTTSVFKLERKILEWAVSRPSTDAQAQQMASGFVDEFSAWYVEKRSLDQVLLSDFQGRTRSWLMIEPVALGNGAATRLYFGSAVVPEIDRSTGKAALGLSFRALLGFHKVYSVILLRAAKSQLRSSQNIRNGGSYA